MNRDHDKIVERCKALLIASVPKPATTKTRSIGGAQTAQLTFKPQSDLKPAYLAKDCSLTEFNTFTKNIPNLHELIWHSYSKGGDLFSPQGIHRSLVAY